jgi:hypothetical protein
MPFLLLVYVGAKGAGIWHGWCMIASYSSYTAHHARVFNKISNSIMATDNTT